MKRWILMVMFVSITSLVNAGKYHLSDIDALFEVIFCYDDCYHSMPENAEMLAKFCDYRIQQEKLLGEEGKEKAKISEYLRKGKYKIISGPDFILVLKKKKVIFTYASVSCENTRKELKNYGWSKPLLLDKDNLPIEYDSDSDMKKEYSIAIKSFLTEVKTPYEQRKVRTFKYTKNGELKILCNECMCEIEPNDIMRLSSILNNYVERFDDITGIIFSIKF